MARTSPRKPSIREISHRQVRWIDVEEPNAAAVKRALGSRVLHPLDVEDILSPAQRPKLERRPDYLFAVLRFSRNGGRQGVVPSELDAVLYEDTLITFHGRELAQVRDVLSDAVLFTAKRAELLERGADYALYDLLRRTFEQAYSATDQFSRKLDALETRIFARHSRETTFDVADLRRDITDYRKIAKPQSAFLRELASAVADFSGAATTTYWRSLPQITDSQWEQLEAYHETIEALADTNSTLVGHRLNETFRLLTIISTIFLPATFVLALLSSDIPGAPLAEHPIGFAVVVAVLVLAEAGFVWMLRRLKVL